MFVYLKKTIYVLIPSQTRLNWRRWPEIAYLLSAEAGAHLGTPRNHPGIA